MWHKGVVIVENISNKEMQRKRMQRYFIEATQQIIELEGIDAVSIRKVAKLTGYNGATIYNYFKDVNELILLASMKYLKSYYYALTSRPKEEKDLYKNYVEVWDCFCETVFEYPKIFYNLFFNTNSEKLDLIEKRYISIFEDETEKPLDIIPELHRGETILERNLNIMIPLAEAGIIDKQQISTMNYIIISCFCEILRYKCLEENADSCMLKAKMAEINKFVLAQGNYKT